LQISTISPKKQSIALDLFGFPTKILYINTSVLELTSNAFVDFSKGAIMPSTLLQVRVDEKTRSAAGSIYEKLGIDLPTAVRMFLARTILENGIPFSMKLRPAAPADVLEAMKQASQSAADAGVADMSLDEINDEIAQVREGK